MFDLMVLSLLDLLCASSAARTVRWHTQEGTIYDSGAPVARDVGDRRGEAPYLAFQPDLSFSSAYSDSSIMRSSS
jgi:hypothetical protein